MAVEFGVATLLDDDARQVTEKPVYEPSGFQRTIFGIVFLILLPFYASLPVMIYQRIATGVLFDTWGLAVIAIGFTILMLLILFELIYALRTRVALDDDAIRFTIPRGGPGLIPMLSYRKETVPWEDVAGVELRREVYGGSFTPVVMASTRILLKNGTAVLLGSVNENNPDHSLPFHVIGRQIARAADVPFKDLGYVKRNERKPIVGVAEGEGDGTPLSVADVAKLNRRHNEVVIALASVIALLFALSIAADVMDGNSDLGERAPNTPIFSKLF
ncbi:MAG: hypothetical protein AAFO62_10605 [Pseudomonadota bacterium]